MPRASTAAMRQRSVPSMTSSARARSVAGTSSPRAVLASTSETEVCGLCPSRDPIGVMESIYQVVRWNSNAGFLLLKLGTLLLYGGRQWLAPSNTVSTWTNVFVPQRGRLRRTSASLFCSLPRHGTKLPAIWRQAAGLMEESLTVSAQDSHQAQEP